MRMKLIVVVVAAGVVACGGDAATAEEVETTPTSGSEDTTDTTIEVAATQPDAGLLQTHLGGHGEYPTSREQILAACAHTEEFSDAEKAWIEQNIPEGEYQSADEVIAAVGL